MLTFKPFILKKIQCAGLLIPPQKKLTSLTCALQNLRLPSRAFLFISHAPSACGTLASRGLHAEFQLHQWRSLSREAFERGRVWASVKTLVRTMGRYATVAEQARKWTISSTKTSWSEMFITSESKALRHPQATGKDC